MGQGKDTRSQHRSAEAMTVTERRVWVAHFAQPKLADLRRIAGRTVAAYRSR